MEENAKRKIDVTIAGITLSLVTDENESFVNSVVKLMNDTMTSLLNHKAKRSQLDAAMLCAIDFCGDKILAEKKVRNLEAQISLYEVNLHRLKEENLSLRKKLEGEQPAESDSPALPESDASDEHIKIGSETPHRASPSQPSSDNCAPKGDKLKMIEELLKKQ